MAIKYKEFKSMFDELERTEVLEVRDENWHLTEDKNIGVK